MGSSRPTADNRRMRRIWVTALVSGLLVCVPTAATVLAKGAQDSPPAANALAMARGGAEIDERRDNDGLGPPPWAHAGGGLGAQRGKAAQSWKDEWRALTPAQKAEKMAELSRAHEQGMRKWSRCVRAAGTDSAKRRACERPLPPGLAKKQP
jgi:hypothetical protein